MISVHQPQVKPQRSKQFESLNARRLRVQIVSAVDKNEGAWRTVSGLSASTIAPRAT